VPYVLWMMFWRASEWVKKFPSCLTFYAYLFYQTWSLVCFFVDLNLIYSCDRTIIREVYYYSFHSLYLACFLNFKEWRSVATSFLTSCYCYTPIFLLSQKNWRINHFFHLLCFVLSMVVWWLYFSCYYWRHIRF